MQKRKQLIICLILGILIFSQNAFSKEKAATRIVCLNPAGFEILCAIGSENFVVAKNDFCDYPKIERKIPSAGGFDGKSINVESILAFRPDFVYGVKGMHDFLAGMAEDFKFELYLSNAISVDAILEEIIFIGEKTGNPQNAKNLVSEIKNYIEEKRSENSAPAKNNLNAKNKVTEKNNTPVRNNSPAKNNSVYWETWNSPYMSIGKSSFINEIIEIAGGKNIFGTLEQAYPIVSEEAILIKNPDLIILQSDSPETKEKIKMRTGWENLNAVKNNRIYTVNSDIFTRSGPRIVEAIEILSGILNGKNE